MELKTLQIEIVLTEMLAERNKMILQQNDTIVAAQKEVDELKANNSDLQNKIKALEPKE